MNRLRPVGVLALLLTLLAAAGAAQAQEGPATVQLTQHPQLGSILTDSDGRTLYLFTNDQMDTSNCTGGCAQAWPPLTTQGDPVAGEGVAANRLATITRDDGSTQVTYSGWPLYYYSGDAQPGDASGQDVAGRWFVVSSYGGPVFTSASVQVTQNAQLGNMLTDNTGRTLYLFTRDQLGTSNCSGNCALLWPPLLTVNDPQAGDGATADLLGTLTRADGHQQVTYNGWPLYYFDNDAAPGDTNGQDFGGVWYVLSPDGGPIFNSATVRVTEHAELGMILTDARGRTLYLFTRDEPNVSNCSGGCARRWPPLLTIRDPQPGEGADAAMLGTIARADGARQVTYNSQPLYYFSQDAAPGDTNGQNSGTVWFVLTAQGTAVQPAQAQPTPTPVPTPQAQTPSVGDPAIPALARAALIASLALVAGGLVLLRTRTARRRS